MIPRRLSFMCRRFVTLCSILISRVNEKNNWDKIAGVYYFSHDLWRWNRRGVPKRRHKIQTPGNHPKERMQHSQHSKTMKPHLTFVVIGRLFCLPVLHITTLCPDQETISPGRVSIQWPQLTVKRQCNWFCNNKKCLSLYAWCVKLSTSAATGKVEKLCSNNIRFLKLYTDRRYFSQRSWCIRSH